MLPWCQKVYFQGIIHNEKCEFSDSFGPVDVNSVRKLCMYIATAIIHSSILHDMCIVLILLLILFSMITYIFIITVTGIPILSLDNCSAIASFTCIVNEPAMHWEIHFSGDNMIEGVIFLRDTTERPISIMNLDSAQYEFNV